MFTELRVKFVKFDHLTLFTNKLHSQNQTQKRIINTMTIFLPGSGQRSIFSLYSRLKFECPKLQTCSIHHVT